MIRPSPAITAINGDDMLEKFERYPLTFGPTHIEKLERLSQHLGGKVELYDRCVVASQGAER